MPIARLKDKWGQWGSGVELEILPSPYQSLVTPIRIYIDQLSNRYHDDVLTVVLPGIHSQSLVAKLLAQPNRLRRLKTMLLFTKNVVVVSVPYHLDH
jgi:hypothetical protein